MKRLLFPLLVVLAAAACSKEKDEPAPDNTDPVKSEAPKVVSTTPAANAADVELLEEIVIRYDKPVTLVSKPTISINGTYYDETAYTVDSELFIPVSLESGTTYRVRVLNPSVKDSDGHFAADLDFSFSTRSNNRFDAGKWSIAAAPSDPAATEAAKALYTAFKADFGQRIRSGIWGEYGDVAEMESAGGRLPAIGAFEVKEVGTADLLSAWSGAMAAYWLWSVPKENPAGPGPGPQPDPEMTGDVIYDFDNVVCGNWEAYKYLDNSYFTQCTVGTVLTIYYNDAVEGAQMGLRNNIDGWPGLVDGSDHNYEYFDIAPGAGSFALTVDEVVLKVMLGAGIIIGGHDYTITGASLTLPGSAMEYTVEEIEFEDVVCGYWAAYQYLDCSYFGNCDYGTRFVIHYYDASGAQMGLRNNIDGWPGIVDSSGRDYSYFNIPDGAGDYTLAVDEVVLAVLQGPGIIIGGHDYTIAGVTLYHPVPTPDASSPAPGLRNETGTDLSCLSEGNAFTLAAALTEGSWQNTYLKDSVAEMAATLLEWQKSGKAVLWCPLPAASDAKLWWGNGSAADYVALWKYLYAAFTEAGVHNLLWVWTSAGADPAWYPGDAYVDFVAGCWAPEQEALLHSSGLSLWNGLHAVTAARMPALYGTSLPSAAACLEDGTLWSAAVLDGRSLGDNGAAFIKDWMASEIVVNASK